MTAPPKSQIGLCMGKDPKSIPRQPKRLKLIFITEEAEPMSCSCCSKITLVDKGRKRLPIKKKTKNAAQNSHGESCPILTMAKPESRQMMKQISIKRF